MLCHLPLPYPDELLYSVIARDLIRLSVKKGTTSVNTHIFGVRARPSVELPGSLNTVSKRTWPIWHLTAEDIANQLTLFPYYTRYMVDERVERCIKALTSGNRVVAYSDLRANTWTVKAPLFLRFCDSCKRADISEYGETYWHRTHQLGGVLFCPEHMEPLIDTKAFFKPKGSTDYIDATHMTTVSPQWNTSHVFGKGERLNAIRIAKRCQEILIGNITPWDVKDIYLTYRRAAIERGFIKGVVRLRPSEIENAFLSFYGEKLLCALGCNIIPGSSTSWIKKFFYPAATTTTTFHPVQHALLQVFLESVSVSQASRLPFGYGPWKCPNPYAQHKEMFPIKKVRLISKPSRNPSTMAYAKCDCGFGFSFAYTSNTDSNMPIIQRITEMGPTWEAEARRLKRNGLSARAIARQIGIPRYSARKLLSKIVSPTAALKQVRKWRKEWSKLLDKVPNRSHSLARKGNGALYARLMRHDRDWMISQRIKRIPSMQQINEWRGEWLRVLNETPK